MVDNLLDPTHAEFVHRTSFGSSDWQAAREAGEAPEQEVIGERDLFDETLWSVQDDQMSLKGRKILRAMVSAEA